MYNQSGRYDDIGETFRPPRGGLADKYRATRAPTRHQESVADSDVSFGWVDDVDDPITRKPAPVDPSQNLGKSRRGELTGWNGLGVTRERDTDNLRSTHHDGMPGERNVPPGNGLGVTRGREDDFSRSRRYDDMNVSRNPPPGIRKSGKPPSGRPPIGQSVGGENTRHRPPTGQKTPRRRETDAPALHRDLVPSESNESRQESWAGWRTMAINNPRNGDESWGKMFGRMHLRWSGREQRKQAMSPGSNLTLEDQMDYETRDDSRESGISTQKRISRPLIAILVCISILVLAVVVIVPTVILTRSSESTDLPFSAFNYEVKIDNLQYDPGMNDSTSSVFIETSKDFCSGMDQEFVGSDRAGQYSGCEVTELRNGSVIVIFTLIFNKASGTSPTENDVTLIITNSNTGENTITIAKFTFKKINLIVTSISEVPAATFPTVKCLEITSFENGNINYIGTSFNNEAIVACDTGYVNAGDVTITCTKQYDWSSQPNCTEVTCVNYSIPENSIDPSTPSGNTFQTNITVTCKTGYEINGVDTVMCMANGIWSESPSCDIISCPQYTTPNNSQITPVSPVLTYGSSYSVNCNVGFEKGHDDNVTCLADGTWSTVPTCDVIECVRYTIPDNSTIEPSTPSGHSYRTNLTVTCNPGYDIDGPNIVSCADDGNWSTSPMCNIKSCPAIASPENSVTDPPSPTITYGSTYTLVCSEGYESDGDVQVTCGKDGAWSSSPGCSIIVCDAFSAVDNGATEPIDTTNLQYNSTVSVTCNDGYNLSSEDIVKCQTNKTWSFIPVCNPVECEEYTQPSNSNVEEDKATTGQTFMSVLKLQCDGGFIIDGNNNVTCLANGTWSNSPICKAVSCPIYNVPENAKTEPSELSGHTFNDSIEIICNGGYEPMGNSAVTCQEDGSWSNSPSCTPVICPDLQAPANGMTDPQNVRNLTFTSVVNISCNIGYDLSGFGTVECLANRSWSGTIGTCEPIACNEFTYPVNSVEAEMNITSNNITAYTNKISVNCSDGFVLVGPKSFTCNATGYWPEIVCQTVQCDTSEIEKPNLAIGSVNNELYTLQCNIGYTLEGNETISCMEGNWTDIPDCQIVSCGSLDSPHNGTVTSNGTNYGDSAELACDSGFEGSTQYECEASGNWSGTPLCTAVTCKDFELANGTITTDFETPFTFLNTLVLSCDDGFKETGPLAITCQDGGDWTFATKCEPVECTESLDIEHGTVNPTLTRNLTFGEMVTVECSLGYEINGMPQIECKSDGNISEKPTCNIIHCPDFVALEHSTIGGTTETSFESNVTIACNDGYKIEGRSFSICQANKTWTQVDSCEPKQCNTHDLTGDLQTISGSTQLIGKVYGEDVNISCSNDKLLVGDQHIFCNTDGTWTINTSCIATDCEQNSFNRPDHSKVVEANNTHLDVACDDGYTMSGGASVVCSNAVWGVPPNCTIVSCGNFGDPENGEMSSTGTSYLATATLTCDEGYEPKDSLKSFICLASGQWNDTAECEVLDCGDPELPENADSLVTSSNEFGTREMNVSCTQGFELKNPVTIQCTANKTWSGLPSCNRVKCVDLNVPDNSELLEGSVNETYFGDTATIECINGYEFKSESDGVLECLSNKTWTAVPECVRVKCPVFVAPEHGKIVNESKGNQFEDIVEIECDVGYTLSEEESITCQSNKSWTSSPDCDIVVCADKPHIDNGVLDVQDKNDREFADVANIVCNEGYELQTDSIVKCEANGSWSGLTHCTKINCEQPVLPDNATNIQVPDTLYGAMVNISCQDGYELDGDTLIECMSDGNWTSIPNCTLVSCLNYETPENGVVVVDNGNTFKKTVTVECDEGFTLNGSVIITCQADGNWTQGPTCDIVDCSKLESIVDGTYNASLPTTFNQMIQIKCNTGYEIAGDDRIVCQSNGSWSEIPSCSRVECPAIDSPSNGNFGASPISGGYYGDVRNISCDQGYTLDGPVTITCTSNKTWSGSQECNIVICENDPIIENGGIDVQDVNDREYEDDAYIVCDEGYAIEVNASVRCEANGSWTGNKSCTQVDCGEFSETIGNGTVLNSTGTAYGESVYFDCNDGFLLVGKSEIKCRQNGSWERPPECEVTECIDPNITSGSYSNYNNTLYEVICEDGHILIGDRFIECQTDGSWDHIPTCSEVICGNYTGDFPNGEILDVTGIRYGDTVSFMCYEGYTLNGSETISCTEDSDWQMQPSCDIVDCGDPPAPDNGQYIYVKTVFNTTVHVVCNTNYTLEEDGVDSITCLSSGNWTVGDGTCVEIDCGNFTVDAGVSKNITYTDGTMHGSVATVECEDGYRLVRGNSATCTGNGGWSDSIICSSIGNVTFESTSYEFSVGNPGYITCDIQNATNWTSIIIVNLEGLTLASVNRTEGDTVNGTVSERFRLPDAFVFTSNDASLVFEITSVECADQGVYFCGVAVNELREVADFTETKINVTSNADKPSLVAPGTIAYNDTTELSCDGLLGANATNDPIGTLQLQVRLMNQSDFSVLEEDTNSTDEDCNKRGSIQFSFNADNSWDQAEVKCVTVTDTDTFESNSSVISVTASCGDEPFIELGSFVNVTDETGDVILTVECDVGYENLGDVNITCTSSSWSGAPNCSYINCGMPGDLRPALFVVANETNTFHNSTIDGHCEDGYVPEQIFGEGNFIICDDDGKWNSSFSCHPVNCSEFVVPPAASVVFTNGTTYGSIVQIECNEGFNLARNQSMALCTAEASWGSLDGNDETPVCTSVGGLTVGSASYTTTEGEALLMTCNLSSTPGWNRIGFFKEPDIEPIALVDRLANGNFEHMPTVGVEILNSSSFGSNDAYLVVQFANVTCDTDGSYMCGAIKGNISEPDSDNSLTASTQVTVLSTPQEPMLDDFNKDVKANDEIHLTCRGKVGQNMTGESVAQLDIQIHYSSSDSFVSIPDITEPDVNKTGCLIEHSKDVTVTVDANYDGAVVRCVTVYDDGTSDMLVSNNATLIVTETSAATFEFQTRDATAIYDPAMSDPTSQVFQETQDEICNAVEAKMMANSNLSGEYSGCYVTELREGSVVALIVITFRASVDSQLPPASTVKAQLIYTDDITTNFKLGNFSFSKEAVEITSIKKEGGSASIEFGSQTAIFTIGKPNAMVITVESSSTWEMISIHKRRNVTQTNVANITKTESQFASGHTSLSGDSTRENTNANIIIDFNLIRCDDAGNYTAEVKLEDNTTVELSFEVVSEYEPNVELRLPIQMREDRWTLNITCEAMFRSSENRELTWLLKRSDETAFIEYRPNEKVSNPVEFTNKTSSPDDLPCLTNIYQHFDMETTVDPWNNTEIMCALDYGTDEEVLSNVGVFLIVPKNICNDKDGQDLQNPLECTKRVQCTGSVADWSYVFETNCDEGTCWVGPGDNDCENITLTTTTTTTTPAPGSPHIVCEDTSKSAEMGTVVEYACELNNIDQIASLNIAHDNNEIYNQTDESSGITGTIVITKGVTVIIDGNQMNISINTTCDTEGAYNIEINNGTLTDLTLALVAQPKSPDLTIPTSVYLNEKTEVLCTGNVGRGEDGKSAVGLVIEIRKQGNDTFNKIEDIEGDTSYDSTEDNCTITDTTKVSVYFGEKFNQSSVRCVAKDGETVITESSVRNITLNRPKIFFAKNSISTFIKEPFVLECNVTEMSNLETLSLVKDGAVLVSVNQDGSSSSDDTRIIVMDYELTGASGRLKVNITSSQCSDKGVYICEAKTSSNSTSSTKAFVSIKRKPDIPTFYPSLQIVEDFPPWADHPTRCYGEVGYPRGSIALETNKEGEIFVEIDGAEAVYSVDDDMCSTIGKITFYNTYGMDWDDTSMRCVTRNDEVVETGQLGHDLPVTKSINVISESFCNESSDGDVFPHPHYCYGQLTCDNNRPLPLKLCDYTQCYSFNGSVCVGCETVDLCDIGSTPAPTLPPGTPVLTCTKEARKLKNAVASVTCNITNDNITLTALNTSYIVLTSNEDGRVVFNTSETVHDSAMSTESSYVFFAGEIEATVQPHSFIIDTNLTSCEQAGRYTIRYYGTATIEDETTLVVSADEVVPEYSQEPNEFIEGHSVTIECTGNVGGPTEDEANISLMRQSPGSDTWVPQEGGAKDKTFDDETCGTIVTRTYDIDVTNDLNGTMYVCQTNTTDGQTITSNSTEVVVKKPDVVCDTTILTAKIGTIVKYACELNNIVQVASINIAKDNNDIYNQTDGSNGIIGALAISDDVTLNIDGSHMNVSINTTCDTEGAYTININNGSETVLMLALVADAEIPELTTPMTVYLNERTEISCSGNMGRDGVGTKTAKLMLQMRKQGSDIFEEIEGSTYESNEENCLITDTTKVSLYFGDEFNQSSVRCVANDNETVITKSSPFNITLNQPKIFFAKRSISTFIGESLFLECNVTDMSNLLTLSLVRDGAILVSVKQDGTNELNDTRIDVVDNGIMGTSGFLKVNFASSQCSDKGVYICEAKTSSNAVSSTQALVSIKRKPELPTFYPSLQIIENVKPWADHPTRCYGEVGYPRGSIALETNKEGETFVEIDGAEAVYSVDDDMCSTIGNITFYNNYGMDWDDTSMRCITRNDEVVEDEQDGHVLPVTKSINVVAATFCDDKTNGAIVPHPDYCYGQFTCDNNATIPLKLCEYTECRDFVLNKCVDCETLNMCDIGSTPAPTLPPGTPVLNCTKEARNVKNARTSVTCDLTNANITLTALNTANIVMINNNDNNVVFDTSVTAHDSAMSTESQYLYFDDEIEATVKPHSILISTNLTFCQIAGDYTIRYNGSTTIEDQTKLVVTADEEVPEYSQNPNAFYDGQKVIIKCTGNVGGPTDDEATISLMRQSPGSNTRVPQEGGAEEKTFDDGTCGTIVKRTYDIDVTSELNGTTYKCETTASDGQTRQSTEQQVIVSAPVLNFGDEETTVAIGETLTVACTWDTSISNASATITRRATDSSNQETVLIYSHGTDDSVTSHVMGFTGEFQQGDTTSLNTLTMNITEAKCDVQAIYMCCLLLGGECIAEDEKKINVTSSHGSPVLTLPRQLVVNEDTLYGEPLKCTAILRYPPVATTINLEYYNSTSDEYIDFETQANNLETQIETIIDTDNCTSAVTVSFRSIKFPTSWNDTQFVCSLYEDETKVETTSIKTVKLIENNCPEDNNSTTYFTHPVDCHLYTICQADGRLFVNTCNAVCPIITDENTKISCTGACNC